MKTTMLLLLSFVLVNYLISQQCCNITPLTSIGGQDPDPNTAFGVTIADIDGDGNGDVAIHSAYENTYIYKFNSFTSTFQLSQTLTYPQDDNWQYGLKFADIDNDGDKDLITTPFWSYAKMYIYKNNGSGTFSVWQQLSTYISAYNNTVGDVDNDGDLDIVMTSTSGGSNPFYVYKNNGNGTFSLFGSFAGEGGRAVALGDLDNDGDLDAAVATMYYGTGVRVYKNSGNGTFTMDNQELTVGDVDYHSVSVADLDNDSKIDIVAGTGGSEIHIFKNLGNGYFTHVKTLDWEIGYVSYIMQLRVADMNGDGKIDIISSSYGGGVQVWLASNINDFTYQACFRSNLAAYVHGMDVGDINGDMKPDIIAGEFGGSKLAYAFINNGTTTGTPPKAMNDSPVCEGGTIHLYALPDNSIYEWNGPDNFYSTQQNPVIYNASLSNDGLYTLIAGNTTCYGIATTYVTVYDAPDINIGNDTSIATGNVIQFNPQITGGSGNYSYQWQPENLLDNPNIVNPTTIPLTQSTIFYLSVTDNIYGCSSVDTIVVTVTGSTLSVEISSHGNFVCYGGSMQLFALVSGGSGNYTYSWASNPPGFSANSATVTVSPSQTTTYYVTVNDGVNSTSSSIIITVHPLPNAQITINPSYCAYDNIQLSGSGGQTYEWSVSNGFYSTQQNPVIGQLQAGSYWVTLTVVDENGCSDQEITSFTVYPQPIAQAVVQPDSLNLYFVNTANFYGVNTGGITSWSWTIDNNVFNTQNVTYTFTQTGTYPVQLIVRNGYGCYDTLEFNYVVYNQEMPLLVTLQASNVNICIGQSAQISALASGGSGIYTYSWASNPPGFTSNGQTINVNPAQTTIYTVTVSDGYSTTTESITINVHSAPDVTAWSNSPYCPYDEVQLFASEAASYQWSGSGAFSSTQQNPVVGYLNPGTYNYIVVVANAYGCTNSATVSVIVNPQPIAQAFLLPDSLDLSVSNTANFYGINVGGTITSWQWIIEDQTYNVQILNYTFTQIGVYPVQLIVSNSYGCYDTTSFNYLVYNSTDIGSLNYSKKLINISPNPAPSFVNINSYHKLSSVKIYDLKGNLIREIKTNECNIKVDLSTYAGQQLIFEIINEKGNFIIEKVTIN